MTYNTMIVTSACMHLIGKRICFVCNVLKLSMRGPDGLSSSTNWPRSVGSNRKQRELFHFGIQKIARIC